MQTNKQTFVAVAVGVLVAGGYLAYKTMIAPPPQEQSGTPSEAATQAPTEEPQQDEGEAAPAAEDSPAALSTEEREALRQVATIETEHFRVEIDNLAGGVRRVLLTGDERFRDEEGEPIDVVTTSETEEFASLRLQLGSIGIPDDAVWELSQLSQTEVRLRWQGRGVEVVRSLKAGEGPYQLWSTTRVRNRTSHPLTTRLEMGVWHYVERADESGGFIASRSPAISQGVCVYGDETERKSRDDLTDDGPHGYGNNDVEIAAVENVYFTQAIAADQPSGARCAIAAREVFVGGEEPHGTLFQSKVLYPWTEIAAGQEESYRALAYIGPKDRDALNMAGHDLPEMLNLGFFAAIASQLARLLHLIHEFVPNWGFAIILLTFLIRMVLFPLTNLSFKSMARMRRLKPEIDRVNELYKDDPEKKGAAVMEIYRKHKINPLSGCLPSVMQMPVWFALYTSLSTNIELYHMPFALWLNDLSAPDPFYVLPLALGVLMHLQQRLSPAQMDPQQQKIMMWVMPIMITVFMLFLPAGLALYMLTNSALGITQQKFNEYRLNKEPVATATDGDDGGDDDGTDDSASSDESDSPRRKPRRKRRVRRGRA